jgi:perosamine synthetase
MGILSGHLVSNPIPYTRPSITALEVGYVQDAAQNGWGSDCYNYIKRFETAFADYVGAEFAISTSSCTGALHMGLHALGIGPGDEVILPDTTWMATAAPIVHLGATPVFVDIDPISWCIRPDLIETAISSKTKAIVVVHLYGNLCDMSSIEKVAKKYGIPIIEDAAEALGSIYHDKKAGSMGRFGVYSFHGTKTITTGEGGMFVTSDKQLYEHVLTLSNHGRAANQTKQFWPDMVGYKYKMSNIQAALGCAQLERIEEIVDKKRVIFLRYEQLLQNHKVRLNPEPSGCRNSYWMPTFVVDDCVDFKLSELQQNLQDNGIDARVFFWPLSSTCIPGKKATSREYLSEVIHRRSLNMPSFVDMTDEQIERVASIIIEHI